MDNNPVLHIGGKDFSLDESETGEFGITKGELKKITYTLLGGAGKGKRKPQALLNLVLKFMNIQTHGKPKEDMMKIFIEVLREMRAEGLVDFKSAKTTMYVVLK